MTITNDHGVTGEMIRSGGILSGDYADLEKDDFGQIHGRIVKSQ